MKIIVLAIFTDMKFYLKLAKDYETKALTISRKIGRKETIDSGYSPLSDLHYTLYNYK